MSPPAQLKFFDAKEDLTEFLEKRGTDPQEILVVGNNASSILGMQPTDWNNIPHPIPDKIRSILAIDNAPAAQNRIRSLLPLTRDLLVVRSAHQTFRPPLILLSPPRAGSHLLIRLVEELGYVSGGVLGDHPQAAHWYNLMDDSIHSSSHKYFFEANQTGKHHGGQFSAFDQCLCLAMFRHPITMAVSRLNYNFNRSNTIMGRLLASGSRKQKLQALLDPTHIFGDYGAELSDFSNWVDFPNVYPIGFEEIADPDLATSHGIIGDLMFLLSIDGTPEQVGNIVVGSSPTFYKGLVQYDDSDISEAETQIAKKTSKYMEKLGYSADRFFPIKLGHVRAQRPAIHIQVPEDSSPIKVLETKHFILARHEGMYQFTHKSIVLPQFILDIRLKELSEAKCIVEELEKNILLAQPRIHAAIKHVSHMTSFPEDKFDTTSAPPILVATLTLGNIVLYDTRYFYVPFISGEIELDKIEDFDLYPEIIDFSTKVEALLYGNSVLSSPFPETPSTGGTVMGVVFGFYKSRFWNMEDPSVHISTALATNILPENLVSPSMTQHDSLIELIDHVARTLRGKEKLLTISNGHHEVFWDKGCYQIHSKREPKLQQHSLRHRPNSDTLNLRELALWLLDDEDTIQFNCINKTTPE